MKKKATLLIRHLERIYMLVPNPTSVLAHGFIAIHHERILAMGNGDGSAYIDSDTRIIEGRSHIAVPGFIDVAYGPYLKQAKQNSVPYLYERSYILLKHGTMIVNGTHPLHEQDRLLYQTNATIDYIHRDLHHDYEIVSGLKQAKHGKEQFCLSMGYPNSDCLDQLLCAKLYANMVPSIDAHTILASCTLHAAKCLALADVGYLNVGARANILLLEGNDFASVLQRFHGDETMQVIKDGVRLFPTVLI